MAGITTAVCGQAKADAFFSAAHCFNATKTTTGNSHGTGTGVSASPLLDGLADATGISVGMAVTGGDVPAPGPSIVTGWNSPTSVNIYPPMQATHNGLSYTFTADVFKCALIKFGMTGTYGVNSSNYSDVTGNGDEATGAGYVAGGVALANAGPSLSGGIAFTTFTVNPSWGPNASLNVAGMSIYNSTQRMNLVNKAVGFHDFGGQQQISSGTLTVILPTANNSSAIYRVS